jgi:hypothetical protein
MRRRRLLLVAGVLACGGALLCGGVLLSLPQSDPITEANYWRIQNGMTKGEVEAFLGEPVFESNASLIVSVGGKDVVASGWTWIGERHQLVVYYDEAGVVRHKQFALDHYAEPTFFDHLRSWLGW